VQTWNSLDLRMDGRTDWQAGGLPLFTLESTRRRLCVATLLICRQPDTSNSLRIFCLSRILSLIISFFSIFSPISRRWYTLPFHVFLSSYWYRPLFMPFPSSRSQRYHILPQRGSNTLCQLCCCSGLGSHLYAWPPCSTYRVSVFSSL